MSMSGFCVFNVMIMVIMTNCDRISAIPTTKIPSATSTQENISDTNQIPSTKTGKQKEYTMKFNNNDKYKKGKYV